VSGIDAEAVEPRAEAGAFLSHPTEVLPGGGVADVGDDPL
jgi:hypothetical protein